MIEIDNKAIEKDQVLSSLNFMKISDVILLLHCLIQI